MLQDALVLALVGLSIQRIAEVVNELLSPLIPASIVGTSLSSSRVLLWIVAAIFGAVAVEELGYDPLGKTGIAENAALVWNLLFIVSVTDAVDNLWKGRIMRR
jgi:hypothetical protein